MIGAERRRRRRLGGKAVLGAPYAWLILFCLLPFLIVVKVSFSDAVLAIPPFRPLIEWEPTFAIRLNPANYLALFADGLYARAFLSSLGTAATSTVIALLIGFPTAYGIARAPDRWRHVLLMLVILPFWTSFLIRIYAWIGILKTEGLLNLALARLGVIEEPLRLLYTDAAIHIGIVYSYLPFMLLSLYAVLVRMDERLLEAAADLGCSRLKAFWTITVPLARPGIVAGCLLVFIPAVGEFVIPDLLGGSDTLMIGHVLWTEFFNNRDWPVAAAVAVTMVALLLSPMLLLERQRRAALGTGAP